MDTPGRTTRRSAHPRLVDLEGAHAHPAILAAGGAAVGGEHPRRGSLPLTEEELLRNHSLDNVPREHVAQRPGPGGELLRRRSGKRERRGPSLRPCLLGPGVEAGTGSPGGLYDRRALFSPAGEGRFHVTRIDVVERELQPLDTQSLS